LRNGEAVNLREGTRRLALLLGVAGAILGGFASYLELQPVMRQRADHQRFEQLANSSVAQQARKFCFDSSSPSEHGPLMAAPQVQGVPPGLTEEPLPQYYDPDTGKPVAAPQGNLPPVPKGAKIIPPYCFIPIDDENALDYTPSELNSGAIKTVHFENREIASIETQNGQTLHPTSAPAAWMYSLIVFFPVFGFFIPWGAIRAIGWVVAGFVKPS
jgi:hypothetical protein